MKVLIVEDDPDIRILARASLAAIGGMTVREAANGFDAISRIADEPPDIVILDVMMPEMDGLAVLDHIRSDPRTVSIPVVLLTARVGRWEIEEYLRRGATDVLEKPFDPTTLPGRIREILERTREA